MSSTFDADFDVNGWPDLKAEFGSTVTFRPLGNAADDQSVTVVFLEGDPAMLDDVGRRSRRTATVRVGDEVDVTDRAQFVIDGEVWDVVAVPRPTGGHRVFQIARHDEEFRRAKPTRAF